jgi:tRNA(Arg) A34 adenosine deaminase TadA
MQFHGHGLSPCTTRSDKVKHLHSNPYWKVVTYRNMLSALHHTTIGVNSVRILGGRSLCGFLGNRTTVDSLLSTCRQSSCQRASSSGTSQDECRSKDEEYMKMAIEQATLAWDEGEVPVGAVLVAPTGEVISKGYNRTERDGDPTSHAEMNCIRKACSMSGGWRLLDCTLYVTLEPCPMCAGAILQSRVGTLVYGAPNTLLGANGSWIDMFRGSNPHPFHPNVVVEKGVLQDACGSLMKEFFKERRLARDDDNDDSK